MPGHQVPAKKDLISEIKSRLIKGKPSPFELASFKKKANSLKADGDIDNAFSALGIIACVEGNIEECRRCHENAILHARFPSIQISNYAASLNYMEMHSEAIEIALKARKVDMTNLNALDVIILASFEMGDEKQYLSSVTEWKTLTGEQHESYAAYLEEVREANELTMCCTYGALQTAGAH